MKNQKGVTLITVILMIIVIGVIASLSIISSREVLNQAKKEAKEQSKMAVESVVSKYSAKIQTAGLYTPAMQDIPGVQNPSFSHKDAEGNMVEEAVGEDWYLLLQEDLEKMGISYAEQNYLVNYKENIVIPVDEKGDIFLELNMYENN